MNWRKITALGMAFLMLLLSLASCAKPDKEPTETDPEETEAIAPIPPEMQTDYTDDAERVAYVRAFEETFAGLAETAPEGFLTEEHDGKLTVTAYVGTELRVRVPATIGGKPVVAIGDGAFAQNAALTELYLPDSVTSVGEGILAGATQLRALHTSVLGSDEMPFLGYLFAARADGETSVSVTYEENAAYVPPSLQYLELGEGLTAIPDFALFDCNDLICVRLSPTVSSIGNYAMFQCLSLMSVNLEGLTQIGEGALAFCSSLTRLEMSEALTSIGFGAFEGCTRVRKMVLPFAGGSRTENTYLGYLFGAASPDFSAGYYPNYLVDVRILAATSLGDHAFFDCDSLLRVELPETLTSIGVRAFSNCTRLEEIRIPDRVTTVSASAFVGCKQLKAVTFGENASLTTLGINAFYGCRSLTSIKLPRTLTSLPASCFADCTSLATVDLGGVTRVGKNAFRNCTALTAVTSSGNVSFEDGNELAQG